MAESGWIKTSERLPSPEQLVLIRTSEPEIRLARLSRWMDVFWESHKDSDFDVEEVPWWQPVAPPQE